MLGQCRELVHVVMDDLLDESKENGYDDSGLECFSENDEEDTDAEQILDCHCQVRGGEWLLVV